MRYLAGTARTSSGRRRIAVVGLVAATLIGGVDGGGRASAGAPPSAFVQQLVYVQGTTDEAAAAASRDAGLRVVTSWNRVGIAVAVGSGRSIASLKRDGRVRAVHADGPVQLYADTSHIATRADEARAVPRLLDHGRRPFDGTGVSIAVVDSGIDGTHEMFNEPGRRKIVRNLRSVCADVVRCGQMIEVDGLNDYDGHGTHLAGIAAGYSRRTAAGWDVRGVAEGASLVSIGSDAYTTAFGMLNGLNWVLEHHRDPCGDGSCPPIRVVTNSWGAPTKDAMWADAGRPIVDALVDDGVVVVFAQGNEGGDGTQGAVNPFARSTTPGVIGVADYDDRQAGDRNFRLSDGSSRGLESDPATWPDLAAPGTDITSACVPINQNRCLAAEGELRYASLSGTSMAAPYVAGVIALVLQANPSLTPAQVEDLLEDTAHPFGPQNYIDDSTNPGTRSSFDRGHGLVDVTAALAAALGRKAPRWSCGTSVITDDRGDAVGLSPDGYRSFPAAMNDPATDVAEASITADAAGDLLRFTVRVDDLGEEPSPLGIGERFEFEFVHAGVTYTMAMTRSLGAAGQDVNFRVQIGSNPSTRTIIDDQLTGSFDPVTDTISAELPYQALTRWDPNIPPLAPGVHLGELGVTAVHLAAPYPVDHGVGAWDVANGPCPHVIPSP